MITVTTVEIPDSRLLRFSVYHKPLVSGHVNPYGVYVKNGEGALMEEEVGWYLVVEGVRASDGHVLFTRGEVPVGETYEEAKAYALQVSDDEYFVNRFANEPFGGWENKYANKFVGEAFGG